MPYYLRAINRENWPEPEDDASAHDLDADALNDLKLRIMHCLYGMQKTRMS